MRAAAVAAAVLMLVLTSTPSHGQYGRGPDSTRATIVGLLDQSPLLQPTMSVVRGAQFVRQARAALRDVPRLRDSADRITSVEQATSWLESALSGSVVMATVTSTPTRVEVHYRRLVDASAPMLSVVTTDSVPLAPALYLFVATDPATGASHEQRRSCATPCHVDFAFAGKP